jgi:hypothetical protein
MTGDDRPMSEWVWSIAYESGATRIVLADRDAIGSLCDIVGGAALNASARSWPWKIGLGRLLHRTAEALLGVAERHTRTIFELPADEILIGALERFGLIDRKTGDAA